MNDPHKFVFKLLQVLDLGSSNKYVALQNLSICNSWENKLKIIAPTWNDECELPGSCYSVFRECREHV